MSWKNENKFAMTTPSGFNGTCGFSDVNRTATPGDLIHQNATSGEIHEITLTAMNTTGATTTLSFEFGRPGAFNTLVTTIASQGSIATRLWFLSPGEELRVFAGTAGTG